MSEFYLLTGESCPLCTQALQLLHDLPLDEPIRLHVVAIEQQPELFEEYRWLIPVLVHGATDQELRWPFSAEQAQQFIEEL
ncbi:thioredoxin family protein [Pseudidiomarina aestuarii]|nr:thioredoxin family protein [Pseudidiomarina aestuarii]